MWFWSFMLVCDILIPIVMILGGRMMWKHCPKEVNGTFGYRTNRSMKNIDTWKFAHEHAGKMWWKAGWIILVPSLLMHILIYRANENTIGAVGGVLVTIQLIALIGSSIPTEKALKKEFREDGTRR